MDKVDKAPLNPPKGGKHPLPKGGRLSLLRRGEGRIVGIANNALPQTSPPLGGLGGADGKGRNKVFRSIFTAILFLLYSISLHAQADMKGTEFWLTFGQSGTSSVPPVGYTFQIRILGGDQAATGSIYFTNLGTSVPFSVAAGQVHTYSLDTGEITAVCNVSAGNNAITKNNGVYITSSAPVIVYALNQRSASTDATNVLPLPILGTDYYLLSYQSRYPTFLFYDAYGVVATENSTQVYHDGTWVATLNTGDVYYRTSEIDMTGAHITSDKPIAFFAMNQGPNIPVAYANADILFQQLCPVNTWSTNFFVPVSRMGKERIRIIASQNGTNIVQTGATMQSASGSQTTLTNLNIGQWVEMEVLLDSNGCYIQADKPVGICSYFCGTHYIYGSNTNSDPSQAWVPAIEQMVKSATIAPFMPIGATNLDRHDAIIITPTPTKNNTTVSIGGTTATGLSGGQWYDHSSGYSFYNVQLTNTTVSYTYSNSEGLFVMGYGTGSAESYYYLANSAMRSLDVAFYVNDIHNQDLPPVVFDSNQMHFRAEILEPMSSNPGHLLWYIDGVPQSAVEDSITWTKNLPNGIYQVKMEVLMADNVTWKIVESTLTIGSPFDITICQGDSVIFDATIYNGGTTPLYQWIKNGIPVVGATDSTYACAPEDGDVFTCRLVSNADCADPDTVISHTITITFYPKADSTYILTDDTVYTCYNTSPELIVQSPLVSEPKFRWYDSQTSNIVLHEGDTFVPTPPLIASRNYFVSVHDTTGIVCENDTNNRKEIVITVIEIVFISVTITASDTDICFGDEVIFTATAIGDNSLVYQWKKNGFDVGTNSLTYVDTPENDDVITCVVSSSHPCVNSSSATSNSIKMKTTFKKGRAIGIKVVPN